MTQCNSTLEFELVPARDDVCYVGSDFAPASPCDGDLSFVPNNAIDLQITDVQVKASVCTLDNQLQKSCY